MRHPVPALILSAVAIALPASDGDTMAPIRRPLPGSLADQARLFYPRPALDSAFAAATPAEIPAVVPPTVGVPSNWSKKGVIGAYLNNTATANADESRDPTINGTTSSSAWLVKFDAGLEWRSGPHSVENLLKAEYGKIHQRDQEWDEHKDEFRYDGVYRRMLSQPSFLYVSWGCESVFTGPPPTYDGFQPFLAKAGSGFGQMFENMLPEKDRFEWRLGARAQKRWGRYITADQDGIQTGLEAFLRYERQAIIKHNDQDLRYFAQYEGFSQFNDMAHITNLITAGLTYQLTQFLTLDLAVRAYYETRIKNDENREIAGYNQWGVRQDTMLGVAYTF